MENICMNVCFAYLEKILNWIKFKQVFSLVGGGGSVGKMIAAEA